MHHSWLAICLSLLSLLLFISPGKAATCSWVCSDFQVTMDPMYSMCWSCETGSSPDSSHDVIINSGEAPSFDLTTSASFRSLTMTNVPLTITNAVLTLGAASSVTGANTTLSGSTITSSKPYTDSPVAFTQTGGFFVGSSFNLVFITVSSTGPVIISGNSSLQTSALTIRSSALFYGDASGAKLYVNGNSIFNYGNVVVGTASNPTFDFIGPIDSLFVNMAQATLTIGQGTTYGEVDMDLPLVLTAGSTLSISSNKLLECRRLSSTDATIVLDGMIRFDYTVGSSISDTIFVETTPGIVSAYNGGGLSFTGNVNLPLATLEVSGGHVGFIIPNGNTLPSVTANFKTVDVTNGGEIGNHWTDTTMSPVHAIINADSFSVTEGSFDMMEGYGLTINSDLVIFQDFVGLKDHTAVEIPAGVSVLNADIVGLNNHEGDSLTFGTQADVQLYTTNFTWQYTNIEVRNKLQFFLPSSMSSSEAFVFAQTSVVDLTSAQVEIVLESPPSSWGTYNLIQSSSVSRINTTKVSGTYSCLGGSVSYDAQQGVKFVQPQPNVIAPTSLHASVSDSTVVLRWVAPSSSSLPCHHSISGYNVAIGDNTFNVLQQALVLDAKLFPTCTVHLAKVQTIMTSTFTPALRTEGLWSTTDSFINIPAPAAPSALSSTVDKTGATPKATLKFGAAASTLCQCSTHSSSAYYTVTYMSTTVKVTEQQVVINDMPSDHDIEVVVSTTCEYSGLDPAVVSSPFVSTRLSTHSSSSNNNDSGDTIVIEKGKLTGGQIAGIVIGVVGGVAFGVVVGLLVGKRAYTKFGSGSSNFDRDKGVLVNGAKNISLQKRILINSRICSK